MGDYDLELPPGLGLGAELARADSAERPTITVPGESAVLDEAVPLPLPPPQPRPRSSKPSLVTQQQIQVPDQKLPDNIARLRGGERAQKRPTPVAEYDLAADNPENVGDVVHLPSNRRLPPTPHARRGGRRLALSRAAATASRGLAVERKTRSSVSPKERMKVQCLEFADWVRKQDVQGADFVRLWTSTCTPAVNEGSATPRYVEMCSSLGGAVAPFANGADWKAEDVCKAVLSSFADSEVGVTPLVG